MKILISGATGLIGSALRPALAGDGHEVWMLTRSAEGRDSAVEWHPDRGELAPNALEGFEAVVHLAGESIASGRWTSKRKQRIRSSRVEGTRLLAETLASLDQPPHVLLCASAIGYYGDRGEEWLDEDSPPGTGFLAEVCREWEAAADPAREKGIRTAHLRLGMVLSRHGGALKSMLLPFRLGLGGVVGSGNQYWSWIALDDVVAAIRHVLGSENLSGPVNLVAPNPVTNREFTRILGQVLHRPTWLPLPAFAARMVLGQMADELLLASARVRPKRLQETGFSFAFETLEAALRHVLEA